MAYGVRSSTFNHPTEILMVCPYIVLVERLPLLHQTVKECSRCCPFWIFTLLKKRETAGSASRAGGRAAHHRVARSLGQEQASSGKSEQRKERVSGGVRKTGSSALADLYANILQLFLPRFLKYEDLLPAKNLTKNPSSLFLFLLSVPVTVWIESFDFWCSGVNSAGGRRWRWHYLCAVRFSCAPLFYQCTCVVLCLF
jgi:hypothetical protein